MSAENKINASLGVPQWAPSAVEGLPMKLWPVTQQRMQYTRWLANDRIAQNQEISQN